MNLLPLQMYHTQSFEAQVCKRLYYMYKVWHKIVYPKIPSIDRERHKYMTDHGMKSCSTSFKLSNSFNHHFKHLLTNTWNYGTIWPTCYLYLACTRFASVGRDLLACYIGECVSSGLT